MQRIFLKTVLFNYYSFILLIFHFVTVHSLCEHIQVCRRLLIKQFNNSMLEFSCHKLLRHNGSSDQNITRVK